MIYLRNSTRCMARLMAVLTMLGLAVTEFDLGAPSSFSAGHASQERDQPPGQQPSRDWQGFEDPFAREKQAGAEAEKVWLKTQSELNNRLLNVGPCRAAEPIDETSELAFRAYTLKANYYQKHHDALVRKEEGYDELMAEEGPLRQEMEKTLRISEQKLAEVQRRAQELSQAAEENDYDPGEALGRLQELARHLQASVENSRDALARMDETKNWYGQSQDRAQARIHALSQLMRLLTSESMLWKANYQALKAREDFNCDTPNRIDPWVIRRPGKE